ncbi:cell division protein PerM, partial [Streptomyces huiliensis]|uniref:cell division protein PerM n=1 Tax=Streptomyces huiliensis TaxID=2876027 RepID=UPI0035575E6E
MRHKPGAGRAFLGGAVAAGLGLGVFATLVLVLWIVSPYPDSGPAGALHIATGLWLLAHGADLVRTETLSGGSAPVGLTPLLFSVVPCLLIHRAARQAPMPPDDAEHADDSEDAEYAEYAGYAEYVEYAGTACESESADPRRHPAGERTDAAGNRNDATGARHGASDGRPVPWEAPWEAPLLPARLPVPPLPPRTAFTALLGGYLLVSAAAVLYASSGPIRVDPLSALIHVPLVAAVPAAAGVWMAVGCPPWTPSARVRRVCRLVPGCVRRWFTAPHVVAVARAAAAGTAMLFGGAALLLAASLAVHAGAVRDAMDHLTVGWPGQLGVALLSVALLPNAVVWTAAYGLGPGFAAGVDGLVAPLALPVVGSPDRPPLPPFPLLAALPAPGEAGPAGLAGAAA